MRAGRKIIEGKGLDKFISGEISKFKFDVGILQNKPHFEVLKRKIGTKNGKPVYAKSWYQYAGLNLLRHGSKPDGTLNKVAAEMDELFKWLRRPFLLKRNKDLIWVINFMVDIMSGKDNRRRIENAMQAVVRNPILRGDYGRNSQKTAKEKGFNKLLMRTGQLFKNVKARLTGRV